MTLHKDIAQVDSGLDLLPEEELSLIFMKLSKYSEKKKTKNLNEHFSQLKMSSHL